MTTVRRLMIADASLGAWIMDMHGHRLHSAKPLLEAAYEVSNIVEFDLAGDPTAFLAWIDSIARLNDGHRYTNKLLIVLDHTFDGSSLVCGYAYDGRRAGFCTLKPRAS